MWKLLKKLLIYLLFEWILWSNQIYCLIPDRTIQNLDDDQNCAITDSKSIDLDSNLFYLVNFIKKYQLLNHDSINSISSSVKFSHYILQNSSNRKFDYSTKEAYRRKKSISKYRHKIKKSSTKFSLAQREISHHLFLLNNLHNSPDASQRNNLSKFLYKRDENESLANYLEVNSENELKYNLEDNFKNNLNHDNSKDSLDDNSKDNLKNEIKLNLNLINYPLKINRTCRSVNRLPTIESIEHHLNVINKCINYLIQISFCEKSSDTLHICNRLVKHSVNELKQTGHCSSGQVVDYIDKLFKTTSSEIEFNQFSSNENYEELNRNQTKLIDHQFAIYLIHEKSNTSKLIYSKDLINTSNLFISSTYSSDNSLNLKIQRSPISILIKRCNSATIHQCIIKDFSCCLKKSRKYDDNRIQPIIIDECDFGEKTNQSKCRLCRHSKNSDCRIRFILKLILQSISILAILIGAALFFLLKLHTEIRVQIHLNFFLSSLLTSVFSILLSSLVLENCHDKDNLLEQNPIWCRTLLIIYRYSRLSNYFWMVCEALYLHQLVVNAFQKIKYLLKFCLIGWLIPFLLMIPYTIMHSKVERNHGCWLDEEDHVFEWVYHLPPIICLVINTLLLLNITRVLYCKLSSKHFYTAQKTILSITPIFALQYLFSIIRPLERFDKIFVSISYIGIIIDSSQGLIIVLMFCFNSKIYNFVKQCVTRKSINQLNGDVIRFE